MILEKPIQNKSTKDVLIVDDSPEICDILETYCENLGCFRNIIIAKDVIDASSKIRNQKFALILLDLQMPKKCGSELLSDINGKNLNKKSNVVIVSGSLNKDLFEKILEQGVKNFLVKPFTESSFREKVLGVIKDMSLPQASPPH